MTFDLKGKEDIQAFAARIDANLILMGKTYNPTDDVINRIRAEALFYALPEWVEAKIQEQGLPYNCTHTQWCFNTVLEKASLILSARRPRTNPTTLLTPGKGKERDE